MIIRENVPLSDLTTMRLGGPARYVIDIESEADIEPAFAFASGQPLPADVILHDSDGQSLNNHPTPPTHPLPVFILGDGANTIARDEPWDGVIIRNRLTGITHDIAKDGQSLLTGDTADLTFLKIQGGTPWDDVVAYACDLGLTGIEALSKIPGTAGAAPVQNIGAYGQDLSQVFVKARVYDRYTHQFKTLHHFEMDFTYRHSILNTTEKGRYFVISIALELRAGRMPRPFYNSIEKYLESHPDVNPGSPSAIRTIVSTIRKDKLPDPLDTPSAGSFFKNVYLTPTEATQAEQNHIPVYHGHDGLKINSAWLIEQASLKGQLLHGFRVSANAPLVLINESATGYRDLAAARTEIIERVKAKFGYTLEQEPVELPSISRVGNAFAESIPSVGDAFAGGPPGRPRGGKQKRQDPPTKLLNGKELSEYIKNSQAHRVAALGVTPHLLIIRDSDDPVITKYVTLKQHYGADIGVKVTDELAQTPGDIAAAIKAGNQDPTIHGIILQLPIQDKAKTDELTALIAPEKDVDGLNSTHSDYDSATATAILWLLAGYDIDLKDQNIAIVGRGKLVGAPLYKMLTAGQVTNPGQVTKANASQATDQATATPVNHTVTLFHRGSDLTNLKKFDIIISATGQPGLISQDLIKPGAVVVDAGTASEKGILKGDLALDVRKRTDLKAITPEQGGVGPLTVTCLFDHVIQSASE